MQPLLKTFITTLATRAYAENEAGGLPMRPPTSLGVKLTIQAAPMPGAANAPLERDAALSVPLQVSGGTSLYVVDATSRRHEDRAKGGQGEGRTAWLTPHSHTEFNK